MKHWVYWLATVLAVGAALMTAMIGAWRTLPVVSLGLRCLVAALLVFAFVRAGGELAGKSLLQGLAEHELKQEESKQDAAHEEPPQRRAA